VTAAPGKQEAPRTRVALRRVLRLVPDAFRNFMEDDGFDRSAAISYYALFSLIPFLAIMSLIGNWFFGSREELLEKLLTGMRVILPSLSPNAAQKVIGVVPSQGGLLVLMLPVFLWTSTYAASSVEGSINHILRTRGERRYLVGKLKSFALLGVGATALLLIPAFQQAGVFIDRLSGEEIPMKPVLTVFTTSAILAIAFAAFSFTLIYLPATRMAYRPSFLIAGIAVVAWQVARSVLGRVLSATSHGNVVAGSFSAVIAVLLWVYVTSIILLFAAELLALVTGRRLARGSQRVP
jgi:membrane protein